MPEYICPKCHNWKSEKCEKNMTGGPFGMVVACGRYEPLTHADHIRSMSDDELSEFINGVVVCDCCAYDGICTDYTNMQKCRDGVTQWLQKTAERSADDGKES